MQQLTPVVQLLTLVACGVAFRSERGRSTLTRVNYAGDAVRDVPRRAEALRHVELLTQG